MQKHYTHDGQRFEPVDATDLGREAAERRLRSGGFVLSEEARCLRKSELEGLQAAAVGVDSTWARLSEQAESIARRFAKACKAAWVESVRSATVISGFTRRLGFQMNMAAQRRVLRHRCRSAKQAFGAELLAQGLGEQAIRQSLAANASSSRRLQLLDRLAESFGMTEPFSDKFSEANRKWRTLETQLAELQNLCDAKREPLLPSGPHDRVRVFLGPALGLLAIGVFMCTLRPSQSGPQQDSRASAENKTTTGQQEPAGPQSPPSAQLPSPSKPPARDVWPKWIANNTWTGSPVGVAVNDANTRLALCTLDPALTQTTTRFYIWDLDTVTLRHTLSVVTEPSTPQKVIVPSVSLFGFSPDGQLFAGLSPLDGILRVWDMRTGKSVQQTAHRPIPKPAGLRDPSLYDGNLAFSRDGRLLASTSRSDHIVRVWETTRLKQQQSLKLDRTNKFQALEDHPTREMTFSKDGKRILVGGICPNVLQILGVASATEYPVLVWELDTNKTLPLYQMPRDPLGLSITNPLAQVGEPKPPQPVPALGFGLFIPNSNNILTLSQMESFPNQRKSWTSMHDGATGRPIDLDDKPIREGELLLGATPNGRLATTLHIDDGVRHLCIYDVGTRKQVGRIALPAMQEKANPSYKFDANSTTITSGPHDEREALEPGLVFHVWDLKTLKRLRSIRIPGQTTMVGATNVSSDVDRLLTVADNGIAVWNRAALEIPAGGAD